MLELLNQLDGFEATQIKAVMATNRIDILDHAGSPSTWKLG
jgi:ATP-dependent 26S proteasome regulatory subunit